MKHFLNRNKNKLIENFEREVMDHNDSNNYDLNTAAFNFFVMDEEKSNPHKYEQQSGFEARLEQERANYKPYTGPLGRNNNRDDRFLNANNTGDRNAHLEMQTLLYRPEQHGAPQAPITLLKRYDPFAPKEPSIQLYNANENLSSNIGADKTNNPATVQNNFPSPESPQVPPRLSQADLEANKQALAEASAALFDAQATASALFDVKGIDKANFPNSFKVDDINFNVKRGVLPYGVTGEEAFGIYKDISEIALTPRGQEIFDQYKNRNKYLGNDNFTIFKNNFEWNRAKPLSNAVAIHPAAAPDILTTRGYIPTTQKRALSHELPHAMIGTLDSAPFSPGPNILQNENAIMGYFSAPKRIRYKGMDKIGYDKWFDKLRNNR